MGNAIDASSLGLWGERIGGQSGLKPPCRFILADVPRVLKKRRLVDGQKMGDTIE
jgi:hypothetical protein